MVPIQIERRILQLAIDRLVQIFHKSYSGSLSPREVRFQLFDKDGEALRTEAKLAWSPTFRHHLL